MTSAGIRPRGETLCPLRGGQSRGAGLFLRAIAARPRARPADRSALFAIDRGPSTARSGRSTAPASTDPAACLHPLLQVVAKLCGILGRKVDLIAHPVEPEFNGLISGTFTVEIIDQGDGHFL